MLCLMLGVVTAISAADDAKVKAPDPLKALKKVAKQVAKKTAKSSFGFEVQVEGGISFDEKHSISETTVRKDYSAEILRGVMKVTSHDAFRNGKAGAIKDDTVWRNTLATTEGRLFQRLTDFPHKLLKSALDNPKKIEWIWVGDEMEDEIGVDEEEEQEGHTTVYKRKTETKIQRGQPHLLRVTMNKNVALEHFTETINSNCAGGG